jgi:hypothetical protein
MYACPFDALGVTFPFPASIPDSDPKFSSSLDILNAWLIFYQNKLRCRPEALARARV